MTNLKHAILLVVAVLFAADPTVMGQEKPLPEGTPWRDATIQVSEEDDSLTLVFRNTRKTLSIEIYRLKCSEVKDGAFSIQVEQTGLSLKGTGYGRGQGRLPVTRKDIGVYTVNFLLGTDESGPKEIYKLSITKDSVSINLVKGGEIWGEIKVIGV